MEADDHLFGKLLQEARQQVNPNAALVQAARSRRQQYEDELAAQKDAEVSRLALFTAVERAKVEGERDEAVRECDEYKRELSSIKRQLQKERSKAESELAQAVIDARASLLSEIAEVSRLRSKAEAEKDETLHECHRLEQELACTRWKLQERSNLEAALQAAAAKAEEELRKTAEDLKNVARERDIIQTRYEELQSHVAVLSKQLDDRYWAVHENVDQTQDKMLLDYISFIQVQDWPKCLVVCLHNPRSMDNKINQKSGLLDIFQEAHFCGNAVPETSVMQDKWLARSVAAEKTEWKDCLVRLQDTDSDCCAWVRRGSQWIGAVGCASGNKAAKQAGALAKALVYCSLLPDASAVREFANKNMSCQYHHEFLQAVARIRANIVYIRIDIPYPPSWKDAEVWLAEKSSESQTWKSGATADIPVHLLRWTQDTMSTRFKSEARTLFDSCEELWVNSRSDTQARIPPLTVVLDGTGSFWTLDNRRLGMYKMLQALRHEMVTAPCCIHVLQDAHHHIKAEYSVKKTTTNQGMGIAFSGSAPSIWSRSVSRSASRGRSSSPARRRTNFANQHISSRRASRSPSLQTWHERQV